MVATQVRYYLIVGVGNNVLVADYQLLYSLIPDCFVFKHTLATVLGDAALFAHHNAINVHRHLGVVRELAKADHCEAIDILHTELIDARFVVQNVQTACCHLHVDNVEIG